MLRSGFQSVLVVVATCVFGLTASVAMADKGSGHKGGGHHGGGHHGGGHHGGGHHGGGNAGGHGHHSSHAHSGHVHSGHSSNRYNSGHYYGGNRYGSGFGFSRGGISLSIGGGYPYGYGGYGYGGYGYGGYGGYGYGGFGSPHVGIPVYGISPSIYSPYRNYGYSPYYPDQSSSWLGYTQQPSYGYRYDRVPATNYVVPDSSRQYTQVAPVDQTYSAAKPVAPSDDLRPGMVLPDGSTVVSVGPLDPAAQAEVNEETGTDDSSEVGEPVEIEPVPLDQDPEELQPPTEAELEPTSASL